MLFSVIRGTPHVELALKSKQKMERAVKLIESGHEMTVADALAIFGQTVWACCVTGHRLGDLYYVIKFIRRIQRKEMNERIVIWKCIRQLWIRALTDMTTRHFTAPQCPNATAIMYTDSCLSGWGVVILDYHRRPIQVFAGRWTTAERKSSINVLELRALRNGIRILSSIKDPLEVIALTAYIDNTSARTWALRARAARWSTNQLAIQVHDELRQANIQLAALDYIESEKNIADKPSRVFTT